MIRNAYLATENDTVFTRITDAELIHAISAAMLKPRRATAVEKVRTLRR